MGTRQQGTNIGGRVQAASVDWCGGDSFGRARALCDVSKGFWQYVIQMIVSFIINSNTYSVQP